MQFFSLPTAKETGGGLPYISHRGMCRPIGWGFLRRFGLKTGIQFTYFGLESGMVFEGTTESGMNVRKKEKYEHSKWISILFCLRSNG